MSDTAQVWVEKSPNPAKRYLMEYRTLIRRRDALLDELDRLRDANQRVTSRLTATRSTAVGGHGGFENGVIRAVDGEGQLNEIIEHIDECLKTRLVLIDRLPDERQKLVLTYRYINGDSWEQIMRTMHFEKSEIFRCHGYALASIRKFMQSGE